MKPLTFFIVLCVFNLALAMLAFWLWGSIWTALSVWIACWIVDALVLMVRAVEAQQQQAELEVFERILKKGDR